MAGRRESTATVDVISRSSFYRRGTFILLYCVYLYLKKNLYFEYIYLNALVVSMFSRSFYVMNDCNNLPRVWYFFDISHPYSPWK